MATANTASLDCRVKSFIKNWEMEVSKGLQSTKVKLLLCTPHERANLKTKIETLGAVLDLLQCKNTRDTWGYDQREEIAALKLKLNEAEAKQKKAAESLLAQKRINRDLRHQPAKGHCSRVQTAKETSEDKEVQVNQVSRLSPESAINFDLRSKLEEASNQLHRALSQMNTKAPDDDEFVLCNTEPYAPAAASAESLSSHTTVSDELKDPGEEDELIGKGEEEVLCLKISRLQQIVDDTVYQVEATLKSQRVKIAQLETEVKRMEKLLKIQREEAKKALQNKERV